MRIATIIITMSTALFLGGCGDDSGVAAPDSGPAPDVSAALPDAGLPAPTPDASPAQSWAVLVRGTLYTADMTQARATHDSIAQGGEPAAKAAGDVGHDVLLGTSLMGSTPDEFLAIDTWSDLQGMQSFYGDPTFAAAFAQLFQQPPQPELFVHRPGWHGWGSLDAADGAPSHYFVVVRGRLKAADAQAAQQAHDQVAAAGEAQVRAAGDVAHVVYTGLQDGRELLAVDVWKDSTNLVQVYSDPAFQQAFAGLFEGAPSVAVYRSTDWHQW